MPPAVRSSPCPGSRRRLLVRRGFCQARCREGGRRERRGAEQPRVAPLLPSAPCPGSTRRAGFGRERCAKLRQGGRKPLIAAGKVKRAAAWRTYGWGSRLQPCRKAGRPPARGFLLPFIDTLTSSGRPTGLPPHVLDFGAVGWASSCRRGGCRAAPRRGRPRRDPEGASSPLRDQVTTPIFVKGTACTTRGA